MPRLTLTDGPKALPTCQETLPVTEPLLSEQSKVPETIQIHSLTSILLSLGTYAKLSTRRNHLLSPKSSKTILAQSLVLTAAYLNSYT